MRSILGKRIADARKAKGLKKAELARAIGKKASTITRIEEGETWAEIDTLQRIANTLETSVESFFAEKDYVREPTATEMLATLAKAIETPEKRQLIRIIAGMNEPQVRHILTRLETEAGRTSVDLDSLASEDPSDEEKESGNEEF